MGQSCTLLQHPEEKFDRHRARSNATSYIIRKGSLDAGRFALEGSRQGNVTYMHANMKCLGPDRFEMIVNRTARICKHMADTLGATGLFEVVFEPMMNTSASEASAPDSYERGVDRQRSSR